MKFADIKGQEDIKEHLQNAIAIGKTSHAYIISGEKDAGKMMLAEAFAQTLLCQDRGKDACGNCHSCKQCQSQTTRISAMFRMKSQIPFRWRTSDSRSITTLSSSLMRANTRSILWMRRKR